MFAQTWPDQLIWWLDRPIRRLGSADTSEEVCEACEEAIRDWGELSLSPWGRLFRPRVPRRGLDPRNVPTPEEVRECVIPALRVARAHAREAPQVAELVVVNVFGPGLLRGGMKWKALADVAELFPKMRQ